MSSIACAACEQPQPADWGPGDVCVRCGGVVRAETRCAGCTRWTPTARFCRHCAAELLPDAWYGAARMLVEAGVDRLSLASRVRALDPAQREVFAARFASQRALVEQVVALARFAESFLITAGHADALEDELIAGLPRSDATLARWRARPAGPYDRVAQLDEARTGAIAPETGALAAIALARTGDHRREVLAEVAGCSHAEHPLALDAAVALVRVEQRDGHDVIGRRLRDLLAVVLPAWTGHRAGARGDAASRAARRDDGAPPRRLTRPLELALTLGLLHERTCRPGELADRLAADDLPAVLAEGLTATDVVIRVGCARLLDDEVVLAELAGDPVVGELARRALAGRGSARLVAHFRGLTDDAARLDVLRAWPSRLGDAAFLAVVESLAGGGEAYRDRARSRLASTPFADVAPAARAAFAEHLRTAELGPERALDLLRWAVDTDDSARPFRDHDEVAPFAAVAARALAALPAARATVELHGVDRLVAVATTGAPFALLLGWLGHADSAPYALRRVFALQGYLGSYARPPDRRGIELLLALWAAVGPDGQATLAPVLAEAAGRETGSAARDDLVAALWQRFLEHPAERAALWQATAAYRDLLEERRDHDPRADALDGGEPGARFALYSAFDLRAAPRLLQRIVERAADHPSVVGLTPVVLARAGALLEAGEHRHGMWLFASWSSEIVNRFRSDDRREVWRGAALGLAEASRALAAIRARTRPNDPADSLATFDQQIETELRLAAEVVEHEEDERARERERALAAERRVAERRAAAEERAAAQRAVAEAHERDMAQRAADAAARLAAAQAAIAAATPAAGVVALDHEPLLAGHPLPTLADYAGVLRALQGGADVMALFAARGLTPQSWAACAGAWSALLAARPDIAMRFVALLQ